MRTPLESIEQMSSEGMWLTSAIGWSFVCRCNWRSGIKPDDADVYEAMKAHFESEHNVKAQESML